MEEVNLFAYQMYVDYEKTRFKINNKKNSKKYQFFFILNYEMFIKSFEYEYYINDAKNELRKRKLNKLYGINC
jgi:hypothetical protein